MILRSVVVVAALAASSLVHAQETPPAAEPPPPAPSADEIKRVAAYYLHGQAAGPILMELTLCSEIGKNTEGKLACGAELPASVKKGDPITAFVKFFAPKGGKYEDLKIRFLLDGEVRTTSDMTVTESWTGYANYKKTTASKAGTWEVQVLRGDVVLASKKVTAT
ncbi:MAG: hypothetical protein Q8O67_04090 [Deltaproteobacteria bacterium]|nr:hypothetical protein [Deltaproteobacteria bacterium]